MVVECKHCGAPLDLADGKTFVRCLYCRTPQQVREMRTIAARTPADFSQPREWQGTSRGRPQVFAAALLLVMLSMGAALYVSAVVPPDGEPAAPSPTQVASPAEAPAPAPHTPAAAPPAPTSTAALDAVAEADDGASSDDSPAPRATPRRRPSPKPAKARPKTPVMSKKDAQEVLEPELLACMKKHGTHHVIVRIGQGYGAKKTGPLGPLTIVDKTVVNYADAPGFKRSALGQCVLTAISGLRADTARGNYIYFGLVNKAAPDPLEGANAKMTNEQGVAAMTALDDEARDCARRHPDEAPEGRVVRVQATFQGVDGKVTRVEPLYLETKSPYARCLKRVYGKAVVPRFRRLTEKHMHKLTP